MFRFKPSEIGFVSVLGIILFVNYAAMGITKVISVSGFLSQIKDQYTLLVWAVNMAFLILAAGLGWKRNLHDAVYLGPGIALALLAVWAAFRVRKTYEASLLNWQLKRRTRGSSGGLDNLDFCSMEQLWHHS